MRRLFVLAGLYTLFVLAGLYTVGTMTPVETTPVKPRSSYSPIILTSVVMVALLAAVIGLIWFSYRPRVRSGPSTPVLNTEYQAVLLANGSVYFGKLSKLGSDYPVLTDVYYVQQAMDPAKKQATNMLVKRGKEWHAPDKMILNARQILLIEPVNPTSRVAELIKASRQE